MRIIVVALATSVKYTPTPHFPIPLREPSTTFECESTLRPDPTVQLQIFMAPVFRGDVDEERRQKWAIDSWLEACRSTKARLVLLAADGPTAEFGRSRGIPHVCVTRTLFGPPRFDEIIHRIHKSLERGVVVFVNADIGVARASLERLARLTNVLGKQHPRRTEWGKFETERDKPAHASWLAVARRFDISADSTTTKNTDGGYDLWAWNVFPGCRPLLPFDIPPFKIARPTFDNWFLSLSISTGFRHVIDATDAVVTFHHVHAHRFRVTAQRGYDEFYTNGDIDSYINRHLAFRFYEYEQRNYSYAWTHGTACEAPFVYDGANLTTRRIRSNFLCTPCYLTNFHMECPADGVGDVSGDWGRRVAKLTRDQTVRNRKQTDVLPGLRVDDSVIPDQHYYAPAKERWPYSFPRILEMRASTPGRVVILVTANNAARSFVKNFHCNMQRLGVEHHVVAALDDDLYYWGVVESIPVFQVQALRSASAYAPFNSAEFNAVTKMKIAVVAQVLKAGYNVLVSDADVVWIRNPVPLFTQLAATHTMYVQSNAPLLLPDRGSRNVSFADRVVVLRHEDDMASGVNKINSGLYFVPASDLTVRAFQALHKEAHAHPEYNDQPSFSRVLCANPGLRIDDDACVYKFKGRPLEIHMLPRLQFATGAVYVTQTERLIDVATAHNARSIEPPLLALHYNWVEGAAMKRRLIEHAGFWFQDGANKSFCTFPSTTTRRPHDRKFRPFQRSR